MQWRRVSSAGSRTQSQHEADIHPALSSHSQIISHRGLSNVELVPTWKPWRSPWPLPNERLSGLVITARFRGMSFVCFHRPLLSVGPRFLHYPSSFLRIFVQFLFQYYISFSHTSRLQISSLYIPFSPFILWIQFASYIICSDFFIIYSMFTIFMNSLLHIFYVQISSLYIQCSLFFLWIICFIYIMFIFLHIICQALYIIRSVFFT